MLLYVDNDTDVLIEGLRTAVGNTYVNDAVLTATIADVEATGTVTGATNASPIVISSADHGLSDGDEVILTHVEGNRAANGVHTVASAAAGTFVLSGSSGSGDYSSGGVWYRTVAGASAISLAYLGGGTGRYRGVIPGTVPLRAGSTYLLIVTASNYNLQFERRLVARVRT